MLCCLFFPKLYIIYLRPEKNVRRLTMNNMTAKQKFANLVKEKSSINVCVSSYASDNTSLTVSSSTKTGLQTDSDKGILTSPVNPTQSTVTSSNCLKLGKVVILFALTICIYITVICVLLNCYLVIMIGTKNMLLY